MADPEQNREGLGVGSIIGETISIFFRRIHWILLLTMVPFLITGVLQVVVGGWQAGLEFSSGTELPDIDIPTQILLGAINLMGVAFAIALVTRAAYDTKLGQPVRPGSYLAGTLKEIIPITLTWIVMWILVSFAFLLLIVPGIWLMAVWSVVIPAIVIERIGFASMARSSELTRGYRWPIVGVLVLISIIVFILSIVLMWFITTPLVLMAVGTGGSGEEVGFTGIGIAAIVVSALANAAPAAIFTVAVAMIYARLREIKEGTSLEQVAEVFA